RARRTTYPKKRCFREEIRAAIDEVLRKKPKDMEEFIKLLMEEGYEVKRGKYLAVKGEGQKTFLRLRSLGAGYQDEDILKIISGEEKLKPNPVKAKTWQPKEKKMDMLLDIQEIIAKGKGPGYERWAKLHNVKQVSQTLIFLKEHGIRDYEELDKIAGEASSRFGEITARQKALESRLIEIAALKKHIINYSKTKDVFAQYRKSGYSKKFYEEHREALTLYRAAKDAFKQIEGQIPKIRELNAEYEKVLRQKKMTYAEYKQVQKKMKEYQIAKYNIDQFLKREQHEHDEHERSRSHPSR
ncbi:MAG: relaxase, partial [Pseudobutyrivibrio sp.]|nr:relaxase [Pseudobutyrivibrio sp.]